MLQDIFINNLAIVSNLELNFRNNMTVITGETGAGKSILLDAIRLLLGERAESQLISPGKEKAQISATFDVSSLPAAILWLSDLELCNDQTNHECSIRRVLYANGRSKAYINGNPATTSQLKILGYHLVQMHGQHQHQLLMKPSEQLRLLDAFGKLEAYSSKVKTAFSDWEKLVTKKTTLLDNSTLDSSKLALLQYQIDELDNLQFNKDELQKLYQEHDLLAHAQTHILECETALAAIEDPAQGGAISQVSQAHNILNKLKNTLPELSNANECLNQAIIQLHEACQDINHIVNNLEINPARLDEISQRLEKIHDCARKHKVEPEQLYQHHQRLKSMLQENSSLEAQLQTIDKDISLAKKRYLQQAKSLSKHRDKAALKLGEEVTNCIKNLGMSEAEFKIKLIAYDDDKCRLSGLEQISFEISTNPGHPEQPINKIASGGELSRISLAIELATAKYLNTPCLIFDEVDVGISGKTGSIVGKALHQLGTALQILCVTHLPQVAAMGDHHLHVQKTQSQDQTRTEIKYLTKQQRIEEIARLVGGVEITAQARANAKHLLEQKSAQVCLV